MFLRSAITGDIIANGSAFVSSGESIDLSFVTATEDKILEGFVGADKDGGQVHGSMPIAQVTETDNKVTVSKGYLDETKEFTINNEVGGTWEIYQIKSYTPAESIVQSYRFYLESSQSQYAEQLNGIYVRKTKEGYYDRYINHEKGKVLLAMCNIGGKLSEYSESFQDVSYRKWIIRDVNESDNYDTNDVIYSNAYAYDNGWNDNASLVFSLYVRGGTTFHLSQGNLPISVSEWHPETIIGNKATDYSGDSPVVSDEDTELNGFQYSAEVGKSYVTKDGFVIGHPCFMPDIRITLRMSGMDDYDANANGIYTQNDFMESSQLSTWSNSNGYTIKYDFSMGQWSCFAPSGTLVASGGNGNSPVGAWYEMVQWSGAEVTLELYTE